MPKNRGSKKGPGVKRSAIIRRKRRAKKASEEAVGEKVSVPVRSYTESDLEMFAEEDEMTPDLQRRVDSLLNKEEVGR